MDLPGLEHLSQQQIEALPASVRAELLQRYINSRSAGSANHREAPEMPQPQWQPQNQWPQQRTPQAQAQTQIEALPPLTPQPWHATANRTRQLEQMLKYLVQVDPTLATGRFIPPDRFRRLVAHIERQRASNSTSETVYVAWLRATLVHLAEALQTCKGLAPAQALQHFQRSVERLPTEAQAQALVARRRAAASTSRYPIFEATKAEPRKAPQLRRHELSGADATLAGSLIDQIVAAFGALQRVVPQIEASTRHSPEQKRHAYRQMFVLQDYATAALAGRRRQPPVYPLSCAQLAQLLQRLQQFVPRAVAATGGAQPQPSPPTQTPTQTPSQPAAAPRKWPSDAFVIVERTFESEAKRAGGERAPEPNLAVCGLRPGGRKLAHMSTLEFERRESGSAGRDDAALLARAAEKRRSRVAAAQAAASQSEFARVVTAFEPAGDSGSLTSLSASVIPAAALARELWGVTGDPGGFVADPFVPLHDASADLDRLDSALRALG